MGLARELKEISKRSTEKNTNFFMILGFGGKPQIYKIIKGNARDSK